MDGGIGGLLVVLFYIFVFWGVIRWIYRTFFGGAKAVYKTATGQGSFAENLKTEQVIGMGEFQFRAIKQSKTIKNKSNEFFFMQFQGLFPHKLVDRKLSFLFTIYDNTNPQEGSFVLCPVPGFNEGTSPTFQFIEHEFPLILFD